MDNKKKKMLVAAMATVLSVTTIAGPMPVMAQEDNPVPPAIIQQENGQSETAPDIIMPENLQGAAGTALKDVALPEEWTWADGAAVITVETTEYPARLTVDDVTYDYSEVEGYNAENHYVEKMVTVTVEPEKTEPSQSGQKQTRTLGNMPTTYAEGDIEINEINFPDEAFRTWFIQRFSVSDGKISQDKIKDIKSITINDQKEITNLKGIEYLTALETLNCKGTGIASLNVSENKNLKTLYCNGTSINELDVSKNGKLETLYCNSTNISSLDVSNNGALQILMCDHTNISDLDVSNNENLLYLYCDATDISSLDVSGNENLRTLWCDSNEKLTSLTVSGANALYSLKCHSTNISGLDVSENTALTSLDCYSTPLAYLNIGDNSNLTNLNKDSLLPVSLEVTSDSFDMAEKFPGINIGKIPYVEGANYNASTGIMSDYTGDKIGYTYFCGKLSSNPGEEQTLEVKLELKVNTEALEINKTNFPDEAFRTYLTTEFDTNKDGSLSPEENANITKIDVNGNKSITDLKGIEHFTALETLKCYSTGITSLDVSQNTALIYLSCYSTGITSLDVSQNTALEYLSCYSTGITSLDVSNNMALTYLDCHDNMDLTSLKVSGAEALRHLKCYTTGISGLDVSANTALSYLSCEETPLAYLNIGTNGNLETVNIKDLKPVEIEVSGDNFNIADKFTGIDKNKISPITGAVYDSSTGIMSDYNIGTPITYTYDCGTSSGGTKQTIDVTLNLKGDVGSIEINETNFPDEAFRDYVTDNFDMDKDGELSTTEIASITTISVATETSITDLTGIEHFTALESLYCFNTNISSLDVSKNTALTSLQCYETGISSLDVSKNTALQDLDCHSTNVSSLDVSNNTALESLYCNNTNISSLDVSNNTALQDLRCHETGISSLTVSKNTALQVLRCYKTGISSLDVSNNTALTSLLCYSTEISRLDVSNNTALTSLLCYETGISSLDVSNNTALSNLQCDKTGISSLDVSNNTALKRLQCQSTEISSLDVSNNTDLQVLNCGSTSLAYLNIGNNSNLISVTKDGLKAVELEMTEDSFNVENTFTGIDKSKISSVNGADYDSSTGIMSNYNIGTPITYTYDCGTSSGGTKQEISVTLNLKGDVGSIEINETNFPDEAFCTWLGQQSYGSDGRITQDEIASIITINVADNTNIADLAGIEHFTALQDLQCYETGISSLDVSNNTVLINLDCGNTNISSLDVSNNTALESLYCDNTNISSLDVSQNTALKYLYCSNTNISSLDVSSNTALQDLDCSETPLAYLNIGNNNNLTTVYKSNLKAVELEMPEDSFNIADKFTGIDKNKISSVNGADYDSSTGIMSNYNIGTSITYTYDCGTSSGENKQTIEVTLNLTGNVGGIEINKTNFPDKTFRTYLTNEFDKDGDGSLSPDEIADIITIDVGVDISITDLKGIEHFTALTYLYCPATGITSLDVSKNTNLEYLDCHSTGITSLNVSSNEKLTTLECYGNEKLTELKVSGAKELEYLDCHSTGIMSLDVSSNEKLTILECYSNEKLTGLKVSGAKELEYLDCHSTGIMSLDVSSNEILTTLWCHSTPLAYLNIGDNSNLTNLNKDSLLPVSLEVTSDSFDMAEKFPGISIGKIPYVKGANYNDSTGIMSDYTGDKIEYTYDCGTSNKGGEQIYVTLNLTDTRAVSSISVTADLDKTYDGEAVDGAPAVDKTEGSTGAVSYKWEKKMNDTDWQAIESAPTDAGEYRVTAILASDDNYKGATSDAKEFTISQAENSWTEELQITGWIYGGYDETANAPAAKPEFGTTDSVVYTYSDSENGTFTVDRPTEAGTWYVKAAVEETDNYKGLTSDAVSFEIEKAQAPEISLPENLSGVYDTKLSTVELPDGWMWVDGDTQLTVDGAGYQARLTVDDSNYDYTDVYGYNAENHYVEKTLTVTLSEAENTWIDEPAIAGWTYGETASKPTAEAKYGVVEFSYSDSENGTFTADEPTEAGTWYLKAAVTATAEYTGLNKVVSFVIAPKNVTADSQITVPEITADTNLDKLVIKDGDTVLVQGTDYDVTKTQDGKKATVTIAFKGNYTGTITKAYTVEGETSGGGNKDNKSDGTKTDNGNNNTSGKKAVQTGDMATAGLWVMLMAFAAGAIILVKVGRRKEKK